MCGLAFAVSKRGKNTGEYVYSLYQKQKRRGSEGFGFLTITDKKLTKVFRAKVDTDMEKALKGDKSDIILMHHRFPTSTKNTLGTTHPIFVSNPALGHDYYFAHNGVISNADTLKKKHNSLGYIYTTEFYEETRAAYLDGTEELLTSARSVFNDSEALAIELARWIEGLDGAVNTTGGVAFWGIQLEKGTNNVTNIYFGKNLGRQLCEFDNKNWYAISSESGVDIDDMTLFTMNLDDYNLTDTPLPIDEAKPVVVTKHEPAVTRDWRGPIRTTGFGAHDDPRTTAPLALPYAQNVGGRDDERVDGNDKPKMVWSRLEQDWVPKSGSILSPFGLFNAWYTYDEAIDSGHPMDEFLKTYDDNHLPCYVPQEHMGEQGTRVHFSDIYGNTYNKSIGVLDEHIEELIKNEDSIADLEHCFDKKYIKEAKFSSEVVKLETANEELMEKISSLGFSVEFYEDRLSNARDVHDYNESYNKAVKLTDEDFQEDIRY